MSKIVSATEAKQKYERMLEELEILKTTPVYRNLLNPVFSSLFEKGIASFHENGTGFYLKLESEDTDAILQDTGSQSVHFSVFFTNKGESTEVRTLFDIQCEEYARTTDLDMQIIQNVCRKTQGKYMAHVEEVHQESIFTGFGLESSRKQEVFTLPCPVFLAELKFNTFLARPNSERHRYIKWYNISACPMKKEKRIDLTVQSFFATGEVELPPMLTFPVIVAAKKDEEKDNVFFPYFHDAEGWIITEPFLSEEKLHLPCIATYGFDAKLMGRCNKMAMKDYLAWLEQEQGKLETDKKEAQSMLLSYFRKA